jgi:hypothetical protein
LDGSRWTRLSGTAQLARLRILPEGPWTTFCNKERDTFPYLVFQLTRRPSTDDEPFRTAESAAIEEAQQQLVGYLKEEQERRGWLALQELTTEHLGWRGLSPRKASAILQQVMASENLPEASGEKSADA